MPDMSILGGLLSAVRESQLCDEQGRQGLRNALPVEARDEEEEPDAEDLRDG